MNQVPDASARNRVRNNDEVRSPGTIDGRHVAYPSRVPNLNPPAMRAEPWLDEPGPASTTRFQSGVIIAPQLDARGEVWSNVGGQHAAISKLRNKPVGSGRLRTEEVQTG